MAVKTPIAGKSAQNSKIPKILSKSVHNFFGVVVLNTMVGIALLLSEACILLGALLSVHCVHEKSNPLYTLS